MIALAGVSVGDGLTMTLRQLDWMARAKRRDEWDRWAQLLSLIDCRSGFGENFKPRSPWECLPPDLDTDAERRAVQAALDRRTIKVTSQDVKEML